MYDGHPTSFKFSCINVSMMKEVFGSFFNNFATAKRFGKCLKVTCLYLWGKTNIKTGYTKWICLTLEPIYTPVVVIKVIYIGNPMNNYLNISYEIWSCIGV